MAKSEEPCVHTHQKEGEAGDRVSGYMRKGVGGLIGSGGVRWGGWVGRWVGRWRMSMYLPAVLKAGGPPPNTS